jgi:phosphate transport system protein
LTRSLRSPAQKKLESLRQQVLRIGHLAEAILEKALRSGREGDAGLARAVADDDLPIDRLDVEIDRSVLELLALQAPVAKDLREVMALKTAATDLERVGDIARNIAKSVICLSELNETAWPDALEVLTRSSRQALASAILALANYDSTLARTVLDADDAIDADEDRLFRKALREIHQNPEESEQVVHFILVAKNLERVGDHATNIAEDVILVFESVNLKHAGKLMP